MNLDDQLSASGRAVAGSFAGHAVRPRSLRARRRRGRALGALLAVVVLVGGAGLYASGERGDPGVVDVVEEPTAPELEQGAGPTRILSSDGGELGPLVASPPTPSNDPVADRVLAELLDDPEVVRALQAFGVEGTPDERAALLADAGLVIETSIRPDAMEAAGRATASAAVGGDVAALVAVEPATGAIVALAGPVGVVQSRSGPALLPIVMATALESGVSPDEEIPSPDRFTGSGPTPWQVNNFGEMNLGTATLGEALAMSANTTWAVLVDDGRLAPADVADTAERLGLAVPVDLRELPVLVLGASEVSPIALAGAYSTFAVDGARVVPHAVRRVVGPDGEVLYDAAAREQAAVPVLDPGAARTVREAMEQAVCCGTGTAALLGDGSAQFGKTGTTQEGMHAWFAGSTPTLTTVVWVGRPDPGLERPPLLGGGAPAEVWRSFVLEVPGATDGAFPP